MGNLGIGALVGGQTDSTVTPCGFTGIDAEILQTYIGIIRNYTVFDYSNSKLGRGLINYRLAD